MTAPAAERAELPLDLSHEPADIAEAKEMLRRAERRVAELEDDVHRRSKQYNELDERVAELTAALKEQRTQMDYPYLPPAFAATMKRMIDKALKEPTK